jgi:hypothetical protein
LGNNVVHLTESNNKNQKSGLGKKNRHSIKKSPDFPGIFESKIKIIVQVAAPAYFDHFAVALAFACFVAACFGRHLRVCPVLVVAGYRVSADWDYLPVLAAAGYQIAADWGFYPVRAAALTAVPVGHLFAFAVVVALVLARYYLAVAAGFCFAVPFRGFVPYPCFCGLFFRGS